MTAPRVVAVVVTYRPDVAALRRLLDAVLPQVAGLTMVHNGAHPPSPDVEVPADVAFDVVTLGSNLGIARAQNEGITRALAAGASHVLLFDQDSEPAPDMVAALLAGEARAGARGLTVAACGARYHDPRQDNPPPFIRIEGLRLRRQPCADPDDVVAVDYLVSSGCLIPAQALRAVGPMNEDLFIDYVDIEWGLRAAALGLHSSASARRGCATTSATRRCVSSAATARCTRRCVTTTCSATRWPCIGARTCRPTGSGWTAVACC